MGRTSVNRRHFPSTTIEEDRRTAFFLELRPRAASLASLDLSFRQKIVICHTNKKEL